MVEGWTGIDFSHLSWDDPIEYEENNSLRSHLEAITTADPAKVWTKRMIAEFAGIGGIAPVIAGDVKHCADALLNFVDETDIDGFNLAYAVWPESFIDFIEYVVPELQRSVRYRSAYEPGTMREKLWKRGSLTVSSHPSSAKRN